MSNKNTGNANGKGYYIALILCAVAIGISGYLYYRSTTKPADNLPVSASSPVDATDSGVPAVATKPSEPSATAPVEKSVPPKPTKTVAPLSGQTVAAYAMDALSYNQTTRDWRVHNGIDIAAEAGTDVCAAADGTVSSVYEDETMGTTVIIRHGDSYCSVYASLDKDVGVKIGDTVTAGQPIGKVGNTALLETAVGDHLHFGVTCNGKAMDPAEFLGEE